MTGTREGGASCNDYRLRRNSSFSLPLAFSGGTVWKMSSSGLDGAGPSAMRCFRLALASLRSLYLPTAASFRDRRCWKRQKQQSTITHAFFPNPPNLADQNLGPTPHHSVAHEVWVRTMSLSLTLERCPSRLFCKACFKSALVFSNLDI